MDVCQKAKDECKHKEAVHQKWERVAWEKQEVKKKTQTAQETKETIVAYNSLSNASGTPPLSRTLSSVPFMMNMLPKARTMIPHRKEVSPPLFISILTDYC